MGTIDIIIIVIVAFFALVGFAKGFLSSLVSLFGWALTLGLSILTCRPVAAFIDKVTQLSSVINVWLHDWLNSITSNALDVTFATGMDVSTLFNDIPAILKGVVQDIVDKAIASGAIAEGTNLLAYATEILTGVAMILVGVIVSFILIKIALAILSKIFNALTRNRSINGLDKLLGLVFGAAKAALILAIACVSVYFVNMTSLATVVNNEIDKNPIASQIYDTADNYIEQLVTLALDKIDFNEVIANLFGIESNTPTT